MSVLILDNKRIFLNDIFRYKVDSDELYYRNDKEADIFLFFYVLNRDELWSKYKFEYLSIKMIDGKKYRFYSDKKLDKLMKEMENYFEDIGIDPDEEIPEEEHLEKAVESYLKIKDNFIFINQNISLIVNNMDNVFGII